MAWIFDTYSMNVGHSVLGVVTGKPLAIGGSVGRDGATARGVLYCIRTALQKEGRRFPDTRVAIQGFNVGRNLARLLSEEAPRDRPVGHAMRVVVQWYGIDIPAAIAHKAEHGVLEGLPGTEEATNEELIELECDVLVPAARAGDHGRQRAAHPRAHDLRGRQWAHDARRGRDPRGPRHPRAPGRGRQRRRGRRLLLRVGPGLQEYFWKEYEVNAKLNDIVVRAFEETWQARERFSTSMRTAAYGIAVQRVAEATTTRGLYP